MLLIHSVLYQYYSLRKDSKRLESDAYIDVEIFFVDLLYYSVSETSFAPLLQGWPFCIGFDVVLNAWGLWQYSETSSHNTQVRQTCFMSVLLFCALYECPVLARAKDILTGHVPF